MAGDTSSAKKVLVVDDEKDVCVYLSRLLQENGYRVSSAADGNAAMREVETERPDLITLDLSMPQSSGVRFYRNLKERPEFRDIAVIFVTGVTGPGGPSDTEHFYSTRRQVPPPDAFVAKPIDPDEFLAVVNKLIARTRSATAGPAN